MSSREHSEKNFPEKRMSFAGKIRSFKLRQTQKTPLLLEKKSAFNQRLLTAQDFFKCFKLGGLFSLIESFKKAGPLKQSLRCFSFGKPLTSSERGGTGRKSSSEKMLYRGWRSYRTRTKPAAFFQTKVLALWQKDNFWRSRSSQTSWLFASIEPSQSLPRTAEQFGGQTPGEPARWWAWTTERVQR